MLARCLESVSRSGYRNYEVVIVENHSKQPETFAYYRRLEQDGKARLVSWSQPFNYSCVNNYAVQQARGEVLLLLNNDVEAINADWLERMLEHALRSEVGAVGAKLYYPNNTIQHAGVILGISGVASHSHPFHSRDSLGYGRRLTVTQNLSAVTGACLMLRKQVYEEVGGLDERLIIAFNDIDLCLKVRQRGYLIVWTPEAELYHHESVTRGHDLADPVRRARLEGEEDLFRGKWLDVLRAGDPYYNPNLSLEDGNFSLRL
jgi:GT2 family glycosyltransferase